MSVLLDPDLRPPNDDGDLFMAVLVAIMILVGAVIVWCIWHWAVKTR